MGDHTSSSNEGVQGEAVPMTIRKAMCAEEGVLRNTVVCWDASRALVSQRL